MKLQWLCLESLFFGNVSVTGFSNVEISFEYNIEGFDNGDDVFLKQMKGVSPIKKNNRIKKENPKINHKPRKKNIAKQKDNKAPNVSVTIKNTEFFFN